MAEIKNPRRRLSSPQFKETLHGLNQRYKQAWDRAERLQVELDNIKKSRAYRFFGWWRRLSGFCRERPTSHSISPFPFEILDHHQAPATGTVSIVIPFKDHLDLLRNYLRSLRNSSHQPQEIILLDNGSTCSRMLRFLHRIEGLAHFKVVPCPGPFNFSRLCNMGARQAGNDFLLFLNNDVEVLTPDWLAHLLRLGNVPDVGVVGATLLYPDGTLQHAGLFPQNNGKWDHVYRGYSSDHPGKHGELTRDRTVPAVTGACLMMRRSLFMEIGGFDERFGMTYNDVDLCQRVRERGFKVAISSKARLWHLESVSRGFSRS